MFDFKKIYLFLCIFISSCLLTGCVSIKINEELTIKQNNTFVHSISLLANDKSNLFTNEINDVFKTKLTNLGFYNLFPIEELDYFGFKGTKVDKISSISNINNDNGLISIKNDNKDYFICKYYKIDCNINIDKVLTDEGKQYITLQEYKFTLNLPVTIINCNANQVYNNGKSAIWNIGNNNKFIHVEFILWNFNNIIILLSTLIIIAICIIINLYYKSIKNKKKYICKYCSMPINKNDKFCTNCGRRVTE